MTVASSTTNAVVRAFLSVVFSTGSVNIDGTPIAVVAAVNTEKTPSPNYVGECKACDKGTYSLPGNDTCINCPDGYSSDQVAAPACTGCAQGRYFLRLPNTNSSSCKNCL